MAKIKGVDVPGKNMRELNCCVLYLSQPLFDLRSPILNQKKAIDILVQVVDSLIFNLQFM